MKVDRNRESEGVKPIRTRAQHVKRVVETNAAQKTRFGERKSKQTVDRREPGKKS